MFHYFEAITNTSGDSLIGYFARVVDPATQNTVTISADDNGTPIVTTSGVENAAVTDAYGNLDFYVVPGTYHLDIYAPNATSLILRVQNVSMNSTKGDTGEPGPQGDPGEGLEEVMAPTGSGLVGYGPITVKDTLDEVPRVTQQGALPDLADATALIRAAIANADTSGGRAVRVRLPGRPLYVSDTIDMRDRVTLIGDRRSTIIIPTFSGKAVFRFKGVSDCGLEGARISLPVNGIGVEIVTDTGKPVQFWHLKELEFAGNGSAGQRGIYAHTTNGQIIADGRAIDLNFISVDRAIVELNTEGNRWYDINIDQWGYATGSCGLECQSLASQYFGVRIAGAPVAGTFGYKQTGSRNAIFGLNVDSGASCQAVNITGIGNSVHVTRPELLTPLGSFVPSTRISDTEGDYSIRRIRNGSTLAPVNFVLGAGFGSAATVSAISGTDECVKFVINAAGTGFAANPRFDFYFADGPRPDGYIVTCHRDAGSQIAVNGALQTTVASHWSLLFPGTPADNESYTFVVRVH